MSKHTPGTWIADGKDIRSEVRTPGSLLVAEAHFREDPEETDANARLIAAAPDLLDALEAFGEEPCPDSVWEWIKNTKFWEMREAALAKAEGKRS